LLGRLTTKVSSALRRRNYVRQTAEGSAHILP
jgi:hypothetical protein